MENKINIKNKKFILKALAFVIMYFAICILTMIFIKVIINNQILSYISPVFLGITFKVLHSWFRF